MLIIHIPLESDFKARILVLGIEDKTQVHNDSCLASVP